MGIAPYTIRDFRDIEGGVPYIVHNGRMISAPTWLMAKGLRNAETAFPTIGSFCILCKAQADDIRPYMANG